MIHKVRSLYNNGQGLSQREIAKELSISRNTVRKYLELNELEIANLKSDTDRNKSLDEYQKFILHLLETYPKLSAVKIARKLKDKVENLQASDRSIRRYVARLKKIHPVKQVRYY